MGICTCLEYGSTKRCSIFGVFWGWGLVYISISGTSALLFKHRLNYLFIDGTCFFLLPFSYSMYVYKLPRSVRRYAISKVDHISHSDLLPHIRKQVIASTKSTRRLVDGRAAVCRGGRGS